MASVTMAMSESYPTRTHRARLERHARSRKHHSARREEIEHRLVFLVEQVLDAQRQFGAVRARRELPKRHDAGEISARERIDDDRLRRIGTKIAIGAFADVHELNVNGPARVVEARADIPARRGPTNQLLVFVKQ